MHLLAQQLKSDQQQFWHIKKKKAAFFWFLRSDVPFVDPTWEKF